MRPIFYGLLLAAISVLGAATAFGQAGEVFHDPFLNWDFINFTGLQANDFEIIVNNPNFVPNGHFDGYGTPPPGYANKFPNFSTSQGDFDNDGDMDTKISWSGANVDPNQKIHVGLGLKGSGPVLDAYWTKDGKKIDGSIAITRELTRVRPNPTGGPGEIGMLLAIAPGFFRDNPAGTEAGWTNIRTFSNLPADLLGLADINDQLDLGQLTRFETQPRMLGPNGPIIPLDQHNMMRTDSFFDVFVDISPNLNPQFEALLVADVVNQGRVIGRFWNLNPQSPEPATMSVLGLGALMLLRRRRA